MHAGRWIWRLAFGPVAALMPWRAASILARPIGAALAIVGPRRTVALTNIALAYPELPQSDRTRLERNAFRNLLRVYLEIPLLRRLSRSRLIDLLAINHLDLLTSPRVKRNGALLLSGHIGNWELLALSAALQADASFAIVVKGQHDYGELDRMRERFGNRTIPSDRSARAISRLLAEGGVVAMLADQSASLSDPSVLLFDIDTRAYGAPARLALRFRPVVVVGFAVPVKGGGYAASLKELDYDDLKDDDDGVRTFVQRYVAMMERMIREHPESWVWHHRRWKHTAGVRYD
jgi:KDO2-lipid IV(A) lauroyltransferase